jgi:hypothetical protein
MLFKDKNLPFVAPQTLEFRNFPYVFQWGETSTFIDLHQFSREKWISLFEVGSKPSNKNSVLYSV